jgi:hypothetical protein
MLPSTSRWHCHPNQAALIKLSSRIQTGQVEQQLTQTKTGQNELEFDLKTLSLEISATRAFAFFY